LVDVTNKVGVDINRAVNDSYYQHLLPFVCGLGPRKAQVLVKKISAMVNPTFFFHLVVAHVPLIGGKSDKP
jgi:transcriptional accessory protein Tex/SPT6